MQRRLEFDRKSDILFSYSKLIFLYFNTQRAELGLNYLQTDENSGDIKFQNMETIRYQLNYEQGNLFNSIEYEIKPTNGMFIIFPSEVWHKITQNNSDITRYSLAMNFLPTGFMGFLDSQTTIKVDKVKDI